MGYSLINASVWTHTTEVLKSSNCEILIYMVGHMGSQVVSLGLTYIPFYNTPDNLAVVIQPPHDACNDCIIWQLSKYRNFSVFTTVKDNKQLM